MLVGILFACIIPPWILAVAVEDQTTTALENATHIDQTKRDSLDQEIAENFAVSSNLSSEVHKLEQNPFEPESGGPCDNAEFLMKVLKLILSLLSKNVSPYSKTGYLVLILKELLKSTPGGIQDDVIVYKINDLLQSLDSYNLAGLETVNSLRTLKEQLIPNSHGVKTKISFKYDVPPFDNPNCTVELIAIVRVVHDAILRLANNPVCKFKVLMNELPYDNNEILANPELIPYIPKLYPIQNSVDDRYVYPRPESYPNAPSELYQQKFWPQIPDINFLPSYPAPKADFGVDKPFLPWPQLSNLLVNEPVPNHPLIEFDSPPATEINTDRIGFPNTPDSSSPEPFYSYPSQAEGVNVYTPSPINQDDEGLDFSPLVPSQSPPYELYPLPDNIGPVKQVSPQNPLQIELKSSPAGPPVFIPKDVYASGYTEIEIPNSRPEFHFPEGDDKTPVGYYPVLPVLQKPYPSLDQVPGSPDTLIKEDTPQFEHEFDWLPLESTVSPGIIDFGQPVNPFEFDFVSKPVPDLGFMIPSTYTPDVMPEDNFGIIKMQSERPSPYPEIIIPFPSSTPTLNVHLDSPGMSNMRPKNPNYQYDTSPSFSPTFQGKPNFPSDDFPDVASSPKHGPDNLILLPDSYIPLNEDVKNIPNAIHPKHNQAEENKVIGTTPSHPENERPESSEYLIVNPQVSGDATHTDAVYPYLPLEEIYPIQPQKIPIEETKITFQTPPISDEHYLPNTYGASENFEFLPLIPNGGDKLQTYPVQPEEIKTISPSSPGEHYLSNTYGIPETLELLNPYDEVQPQMYPIQPQIMPKNETEIILTNPSSPRPEIVYVNQHNVLDESPEQEIKVAFPQNQYPDDSPLSPNFVWGNVNTNGIPIDSNLPVVNHPTIPDKDIIAIIRDNIRVIEEKVPNIYLNIDLRNFINTIKELISVGQITIQDYATIINRYEKLIEHIKHLNMNNEIMRELLLSITNLDNLKQHTGKSNVIELTFLVKRPEPLIYQPYYYVKYRLPYVSFLRRVEELLKRKPYLRDNPTFLYKELISLSNVAETSPDLESFDKEDILKLTFSNGTLLGAKMVKGKDVDMYATLDLLRDINSESTLEDVIHLIKNVNNENLVHRKSDQLAINEGTFKPPVPVEINYFSQQKPIKTTSRELIQNILSKLNNLRAVKSNFQVPEVNGLRSVNDNNQSLIGVPLPTQPETEGDSFEINYLKPPSNKSETEAKSSTVIQVTPKSDKSNGIFLNKENKDADNVPLHSEYSGTNIRFDTPIGFKLLNATHKAHLQLKEKQSVPLDFGSISVQSEHSGMNLNKYQKPDPNLTRHTYQLQEGDLNNVYNPLSNGISRLNFDLSNMDSQNNFGVVQKGTVTGEYSPEDILNAEVKNGHASDFSFKTRLQGNRNIEDVDKLNFISVPRIPYREFANVANANMLESSRTIYINPNSNVNLLRHYRYQRQHKVPMVYNQRYRNTLTVPRAIRYSKPVYYYKNRGQLGG